jgi:cytochrome c oxidase cbb3-type subunit 4
MSSGTATGVITVVLLALFLYGCFWAWSSRRKADFEEAARLPLEDEFVKGERP